MYYTIYHDFACENKIFNNAQSILLIIIILLSSLQIFVHREIEEFSLT